MIAVHSAIYIFRPRASRGEGGLHPYRKPAYMLWIGFSLLMASLAFLNGRHAYVAHGTFCYLPVRPFWYRLALDWIPRYIIFLFILGIYASIYFYVRYTFHGFDQLARHRSDLHGDSMHAAAARRRRRQRQPDQHTVPATPVLATYDWLEGPSRPNTGSVTEQGLRKPSVSTMDSYQPELTRKRTGVHRFMFQSLSGPDNFSLMPPSNGSILEDDSFEGPTTPQPLSPTLPEPISSRSQSECELPSRATSWRDSFVRRFSPHHTSGDSGTQQSVVDIFTILRRQAEPSSSSATPIHPLRRDDAELAHTRDQIQRQLRFLFIYPLVYIGMWIIPFVSHVLQYSDRFAIEPPFALTCCATVSLCMQAAVDAWLFSTREKPWRHIPGTDGGFAVSLKFWADWSGFRTRRVLHRGPGKTSGEAHREALAARQRLAEERSEAQWGLGPRGRARRAEWWDSFTVDGAMSPVREETSDQTEASMRCGGGDLPRGRGTKTRTLEEGDSKPPARVDAHGGLESRVDHEHASAILGDQMAAEAIETHAIMGEKEEEALWSLGT